MLRLRCSGTLILRHAAKHQHINRKNAAVLRTNQSQVSLQKYSTTTYNKNVQSDETITMKSQFLPTPPAPVEGEPIWITKEEAEEYLYPLYALGWGIKFYPRKVHHRRNQNHYVAHLTTRYILGDFSFASQFFADLTAMAKKEGHYPSRVVIQNGRPPTLSVSVLTDFPLRPHWTEEDPRAKFPLGNIFPGISRRDLRFAILLEQLYDNIASVGLEQRGQELQNPRDRPTWEYLVKLFAPPPLPTGLEPLLAHMHRHT